MENKKSNNWQQQRFYELSSKLPEKQAWTMWLLPYEELKNYKYILTCDVDFILLREEISLHNFRSIHSKKINLPFSNFIRPYYPPKRMSGWHFFETKPYYEKTNFIINEILKDPSIVSHEKIGVQYVNGWGEKVWEGEPMLYFILKNSFSFNDNDLVQTFPHHHGIHMGPLRSPKKNIFTETTLFSNTKYWKRINDVRNLVNDPIVCEITKNMSDKTKSMFLNTKKYFNSWCFENQKVLI